MRPDWSQEKAIAFCEMWLTCTTLNPLQRSIITDLLENAHKGIDQFQSRREDLLKTFEGVLLDAAQKARVQGLC